MTSIQRFYPGIPGPATKFTDIITAGYSDDYFVTGETIDLPIPFTVSNQVLDININQSIDAATFVNNGSIPVDNTEVQAKVMGGASLVKSFGTNMTTWLRNRIRDEESLGSQYSGPLTLYVRPFMTKIQMAQSGIVIGAGALLENNTYGISTQAPTSTEYIGGGTSQNFYTAWVFKTPMTVQYETASGGNKYLTMTSQLSGD
jgi:hypothetical protein